MYLSLANSNLRHLFNKSRLFNRPFILIAIVRCVFYVGALEAGSNASDSNVAQAPLSVGAPSNLEAYLNTFGSGVSDNIRYVVRQSYDQTFTVVELIATPINQKQAEARCKRLFIDLRDAPEPSRIANVWVLSGVETSDERDHTCMGER
jgi:hypothetical protein